MGSNILASGLAIVLGVGGLDFGGLTHPKSVQASQASVQGTDAKQLLQQGISHYRRAEFKVAVTLYQQGLTLAQQQGDRTTEIELLLRLGEIQHGMGRASQAKESLDRALKLAQDIINPVMEGEALARIGILQRDRQDYVNALATVNTAIAIHQQARDRKGESLSRLVMGTVLNSQENYNEALEAFTQARTLAESENDSDLLALIYDWTALAHLKLNNIPQAEATYQQQQNLSRSIGYRLAQYNGLGTMAQIQKAKKQPEQVLKIYQQQAVLSKIADNPWLQREDFVNLGMSYSTDDFAGFDQRIEQYQQALTISRTIDHQSVSEIQNLISTTYILKTYAANKRQKYDIAQQSAEQALKTSQEEWLIVQKISDPTLKIRALMTLAMAYNLLAQVSYEIQNPNPIQSKQYYSQIFSTYNQALTIAQTTNDRASELEILQKTGAAYIAQGQSLSRSIKYQEGWDAFEQAILLSPKILSLAFELKNIKAEREWTLKVRLAYLEQGFVFDNQEKYLESAKAYTRGLTFLRQQRDRLPKEQFLKLELQSLTLIGYAYRNLPDYPQAYVTNQEILNISVKLNDVKSQVETLNTISWISRQLGKNQESLEFAQRALLLTREKRPQEPSEESSALTAVAHSLRNLGRYSEAEQHYHQSLQLSKRIDNIKYEQIALSNLSVLYSTQGEFLKSLDAIKPAYQNLKIAVQFIQAGDDKTILKWCGNSFLRNKQARIDCLKMTEGSLATLSNNLASTYTKLGRYTEAIDFYQASLAIAQKHNDTDSQIVYLNNMGEFYNTIGDYPKSQELAKKALQLSQKYRVPESEFNALNNLGSSYSYQNNTVKALEYYQSALTIARVLKNPNSESTSLNNIGYAYSQSDNYARAKEFYNQSLEISRKYRLDDTTSLNNLASLELQEGNYDEATAQYIRSLEASRANGDIYSENLALVNIGKSYAAQSNYAKAQEFYRKAHILSQSMKSRVTNLTNLQTQGVFYTEIGQFPEALETLNQALELSRELGTKKNEAILLASLGRVYRRQENYPQAVQFYQQALKLSQSMNNIALESVILNRLGQTYELQGNTSQSSTILQQALMIQSRIGSRSLQISTLSNLGRVYTSQGKFSEAQAALQQSLTFLGSTNEPETKAIVFTNLAELFKRQNKPELAIVFYKKSVIIYETIRLGNRALPKDQQETYTKTVEKSYRDLADLLLKNDRILEAQHVLDLLKVQELNHYLRTVRGASQPLENLPPETEILQKYTAIQTNAIALGQELSTLRQIPESSRSPQQTQRITQLDQLQRELNQQFNSFTDRPDIKALVQSLARRNIDVYDQSIKTADLNKLRTNLKEMNAVMIYPLILDDRLELIITTPDSPPLRRTVAVKREDLNKAILNFRMALERNDSDIDRDAEKLYTWLIKPLEADLKASNPKTLIYAPDGQLRYIPIAALHDGKQWLIERYAINHITAKSLTHFTRQPQPIPKILAGAIGGKPSEETSVRVGNRSFDFAGLPGTNVEIDRIRDLQPTTQILKETQFTLPKLLPQFADYNILHLATHAAIVPGNPEDSFILFGSKTTATLKEIESWDLNSFDLVILSACQTGLAGNFGANGEEVLGLGYQFQNRGAKATIASLWKVDDNSTQQLMTEFYIALKAGKTKNQSLQSAQLALISGTTAKTKDSRSSIKVESVEKNASKHVNPIDAPHRHPYYWAPFILIGNGQ